MFKKLKNKYPLKVFTGILVITFSFINSANFLRYRSTYFMPKEYKSIKKIVDKIASKNDLGNRDIKFAIGSGAYMEYRAEELGLCEKDGC